MKTNLMTIALLSTGAAFSLALGAAIPKISSAAIPLGTALGGGAIALVLSEGEGKGESATYPTATAVTPDYPLADRHWQPTPPPISPELAAGTIICVGDQGSGKSSTATAILHHRMKAGSRGVVLNHHIEFGQYAGLEIYGRGASFEDRFLSLEAGMRWVVGEIEKRYEKIQFEPNPSFTPITVLMDEMTSWEGNIDKTLIKRFIKICLTDTRKANIQTIWLTHTLTREGWGGVDGVAALIKATGTIINFLPAIPGGPKGMQSSGYADIESGGKKRRVKLADFLPPSPANIWDFSQYSKARDIVAALESAYSLPANEDIPKDWEAILDYLQSRDLEAAKVRELQQARIPRGGVKADEIRLILESMAAAQLISFDGNEAVLTR